MVNWNGCHSDIFATSNGVKQGGVISPILFCIYIDELLSRLKASNVGCNMFLGALGFADGMCLLAPTRGSIRVLLDICEHYGNENKVIFNSQKRYLIIYDDRFN